MSFEVRFSRRARRELALIRAWWRIHRPAADGLVDEELHGARELLEADPKAGALASDPSLGGIRRVLLRRSGYLVFYRIDATASSVEIIAIWHAKRRTPRL